jgi:hypothetical protein
MPRTLIPVILVDHKFQALYDRFVVEATADDLIYDLKQKVKEKWHNVLSRFDISRLTMWKTKGEMIIKILPPSRLTEILENINVDDEDTIEQLGDEAKVGDLGLSVGQTLLVKLAGTPRISNVVGRSHSRRLQDIPTGPPIASNVDQGDQLFGPRITSKVDPEIAHCFLQAESKGSFTENDIQLNNIVEDKNLKEAPKFVKDYEELLGRKRTLAPNVRYFCLIMLIFLTNEVRVRYTR